MGIYNRQYQKVLAAEFLRYFLLGQNPDVNDISKRIGDALDKKSNLLYKYYSQPYKEVFNNKLYNLSLKNIKFDIEVLHEEIIDLFSQASQRINFSDLYYKINNYELTKLEKELLLLLFINKQADFYFDGFIDTFSDTSKIDQSQSTKDIVDLSERCLSLPYGGKNTKRIDVGQLAFTNSITITPSNKSAIISSTQIPNTFFGNIFTDILAPWGYEIVLNENIPFDITFTFPLNLQDTGPQQKEFFVNRFELIPYSIKKQYCLLKVSNDNVNYIPLKGLESEVMIEDQSKVYGFDFETNLVEYVRVTLSKKEADEEIVVNNQKRYKYIFGLKKFASFQTGRLSKATYISKPIEFKNTPTIGKIGIEVNQTVPQGTSTSFYISTIGSDGVESSYIPISGVGASTVGATNLLTFNTTSSKQTRFTSTLAGDDAPQLYGTPFQGKEFYRIGPKFNTKPIYGTSSLFRGFKSWYRDTSGTFEIEKVQDNYISFETTDNESLYAVTTEIPSIATRVDAGIKKVDLTVSLPPYYDSNRSHLLKPQPGTQNSNIDTKPNYAIYRVLHRVANSRQTMSFTLGTSTTQYLPNSNFILESANTTQLPIIRGLGGVIYTKGVDYNFEITDIGGRNRPTGRITIPAGSAFLNSTGSVINLGLEFVFTIDPDITHKVSVLSSNVITLDHSSNTQYDSIEVTYRFQPGIYSNSLINASIRIANLPSTSSSRVFYVEGRDYVVDPNSGNIQRISGGTIDTKASVYAEFSFRRRSDNETLETFTTWAFIAGNEGTQIKFDLDPTTKKNKLVVANGSKEGFYVNTKQGLISLTKAASTPILPNGWVQFIVRSKNPSMFSSFKSNLIDQVIQLKDVNKKKIFRSFNSYFNEITAFRDAMKERTLNHLKVNTLLADHTVFAIDTTTDINSSYIVVNFKPNETQELYNKVPTEDSDETNPPEVTAEDFVFTYSESNSSTNIPKKIRVKIELSRANDTDGGVTPKIFDYQLRVGT
jgi:hypothetical protein